LQAKTLEKEEKTAKYFYPPSGGRAAPAPHPPKEGERKRKGFALTYILPQAVRLNSIPSPCGG